MQLKNNALMIMNVLHIICLALWMGYLTSAKHPKVTVNIKLVSRFNELNKSGWCSWTLGSWENSTRIDLQDISSLASATCRSLGCGDVYSISTGDVLYNSSCLTGCVYSDSGLTCSVTVRNVCQTLAQVICGSPYVAQKHNPCSWTIESPDRGSVYLTADAVESVSRDICHQLGCGELHSLTHSPAGFNKTCFTHCAYHQHHLKNCTETVRSDCFSLTEATCGNAAVRLVGGGHRCGGRVEVWRGSWGTVCDDGWGLEEAGVVCAQLDCGYAVSVSGKAELFGQGTGPIHLDELNCTGREQSLWECPAVSLAHDCGHKEDAGVVCSEHKALRLMGGLDRCSGRVEIHRNGTWGTVCDTCWGKEEAAMACDMLSCGGVIKFTAFDTPFIHTNGTRWYYFCDQKDQSLWQCMESTLPHLCADSKAAGLICDNSLGMPDVTSPDPTSAPATTVKTDDPPGFLLSPEQLMCCVLGFLLLIAVIINMVVCRRGRRKKAVVVQQRFQNLQTAADTEENNYRDSVHLTKVTNSCSAAAGPIIPPRLWPQSSTESGSYDTDYEQHDFSPDAAFPLSTFRNSMRYSADGKTPTVKTTNLNSVSEEVDSFESSSTSSGECYETTGSKERDLCSLDTECYENTGLQAAELGDGGSREDSPLYSPVSYDKEAVPSECDYDDIGNYLQQPDQ